MRRVVRLALALGLLAGVFAFLAASVTRHDGSAFGSDSDWPLVADAETMGVEALRVVSTPAALDGPADRTVLAILAAARPYTSAEVDAVQRFLHAGGRILLADAYGHANSLSAPLGITFERVRLVDPAARDATSPASLDGTPFAVRWSNPSALQIAEGSRATILAASSAGSFLDRDGDGTIDAADPQGSFPIAAEVAVGERGGLLVALADSGPLTGAGANEAQNRAWRQALLAHLLPADGRLVVDESRKPAHNPVTVALASAVAVARLPPGNWLLGALAAGLMLVPLLPDTAHAWAAHRFRPDRFLRRGRQAEGPSDTVGPTVFWTRRGIAALCGSGALLLLGLVLGRPEAMGAGAFILVALAAAWAQGPVRLEATRAVSNDQPSEGDTIEVGLALHADSHRVVRVEVQDRLPPEFELTSGSNWFAAQVSRAGVKTAYGFKPALRGAYGVGPLVARTLDPLRLRVSQAVLAQDARVRVAPRQDSVRRIPFTTKVPSATLGPHFVNRAGEGSEFHSLRDYLQGDSLRSVNWKASARAGNMMVNQRVHESMTRLTILLDARAVSGAGPANETPLANGCRTVLSVAAGALRVRDRILIVTYGQGVEELPDVPGSRQLHDLRELLSRQAAAGDTGLAQAVQAIQHRLRPNTPVLLVSGLEGDAGFADAVRTLRNRGMLPVVIASPIGLHPTHPEDGGPEEGAQALLEDRQRTLSELRALGIPVFETVAGMPLDDLFRLGVA